MGQKSIIVGKDFATDVYKRVKHSLFHYADVGMSERVTGSFYQSGRPRVSPLGRPRVWRRRRGAFPSISWSGASRRCTRLATSPSPDSTGRHGELQYRAKPAPRPPPAQHQLWGGDAPDAEKSRAGPWQGIFGRGPFSCHGVLVGRQRHVHLHRL